ncbi:MAG: FHA domain-containing protein [Gloeocapsa sp. DLM2.Bin57]|nr:MAG: FHA domain-containing protein [Gloeocapsa sp. DLM2.Bin57]
MSVITLVLLHPLKAVPVQNWTFEPEITIRVGRSMDNDVVLYSAVVSRRHLEIRPVGNQWELVNIGANGTYINGKRIDKTPVVDGMIVRLASSGPQIKIQIDSEDPQMNANLTRRKHSSPVKGKDPAKDTIVS